MYEQYKTIDKKYKRKRRIFKRKGPIIFISVLVFIIVFVLLHFNISVNPVIKKLSEEKIKSFTTQAVNAASQEVITQGYKYTDFISVSKDTNGNVTLIETNSVLMNVLARNMAIKAQENIDEIENQGVDIPIGSLSGIAFLAGRGPTVNIEIVPVGTVNAYFVSEFQRAGINQTIHKLALNVSAEMTVLIPGRDCNVVCDTYVLMTESVIVGAVPNVYFEAGSLDGILNLTP